MDVDRRCLQGAEEVRREDLHVAGEDEQVDPLEQLQGAALGGLAAGRVDRDVVEGEADRGDLLGVVGVVGDDRDQLAAELAAAPAPEQVGEAVVFARDHDRHPLGLARLGEAVLHLIRGGDLVLEAPLQRLPLPAGTESKTIRMKKRPSPVECWSASTMLRPASARKPLTVAISPGRSGRRAAAAMSSARRSVDDAGSRKISFIGASGWTDSCLGSCGSALLKDLV